MLRVLIESIRGLFLTVTKDLSLRLRMIEVLLWNSW